jgi:acetyl esterase/lipase
MPSRLHAVYARLVPRMRKAGEMTGDEPAERARVEAWQRTLDRSLPTSAVPRFARHWSVVTEEVAGFPAYVLTPRRGPTRTVFYLHGGGFMAPISAWQVRYAARLADAIGARVVLPDYPLAPEHSWRDSFGPITDLAARWAAEPGGIVLAGDSSGGGYALAVGLALRDRGGPQPTHLVLHAPWIDLTTSTPETDAYDEVDPWLFKGRCGPTRSGGPAPPTTSVGPRSARGWATSAGSPGADVLRHPRPARARLPAAGPPRGRAGWDLTAVETPGLIHVYPLLPYLPRRGWRSADGRVRAMTVRVLTFDELDAHTAYACGACGSRCSSSSSSRRTPTSTDATGAGYPPPAQRGGTTSSWRTRGARRRRVGPHRPGARGAGGTRAVAWPTTWCGRALEVIGDREVRLDAQTGAAGLVRVVRLRRHGPPFDEDGVFHVPMARPRA